MTRSEDPTVTGYELRDVVPAEGAVGTWLGRAWVPASHAADGIAGPRPIVIEHGRVLDLGERYLTTAQCLAETDPLAALQPTGDLPELCSLADLLAGSLFWRRPERLADCERPCLLAPSDLQAVKACGVTFIQSLLERVVEERAAGDPEQATYVRAIITDALGEDLSQVQPGSPATERLKQRLIDEGLWSQYLEVGIGPHAEVFTKCQPMAAVSCGGQVGVLPDSHWNNPEPEVVLAVSPAGRIVGATLGNDVNLRDFEGRSALLLGEAKDQNGSCSMGPVIRLFDRTFSLDDALSSDVTLTITGNDGFTSTGANRMDRISRHPEALVAQACGRHHQYPDGFMLFLGTMFAPTDDRLGEGQGFTHRPGDRVEIANPHLGTLVNWVDHTDRIPPWTFGTMALIRYLLARPRPAPTPDPNARVL